jgi:hypothetical protein
MEGVSGANTLAYFRVEKKKCFVVLTSALLLTARIHIINTNLRCLSQLFRMLVRLDPINRFSSSLTVATNKLDRFPLKFFPANLT